MACVFFVLTNHQYLLLSFQNIMHFVNVFVSVIIVIDEVFIFIVVLVAINNFLKTQMFSLLFMWRILVCISHNTLVYVVIFCLLTAVNRDNDITHVIDHVFCVDHEAFGEHKEHELKPGGRDIPVTEDNKKEYVKLVWSVVMVEFGVVASGRD